MVFAKQDKNEVRGAEPSHLSLFNIMCLAHCLSVPMIDAATTYSAPKRNGRFNSIMPGAVSLPKPPLHPATGHPSVLEHRTPLVFLQRLFAPRTSDRALVHAAIPRVPFCRLQLGTVGFQSQSSDVCMLLITTQATHVSQYQG